MAPAKSETRKWLAIGLAFMVAWAIFLRVKGPLDRMEPPNLNGSGLPEPADYEWTLLDLDDQPVELAKYRGKTIVLNLWATWCGPCIEEMPTLANLATNPRLKGRDIAFLCVSTDGSAKPLRQFLADKTWKMTILRATTVPRVFLTDGIPATFLIAPNGRIVASQIGAAQWDDASVVDLLAKISRPAR